MGKSIIEQKDGCYLCGKFAPLDCHHLLWGRNRKNADKYGLTINICRECHSLIHHNKEYMDLSRQIGQKAFEKKYSHEKFIEIFGKNWL